MPKNNKKMKIVTFLDIKYASNVMFCAQAIDVIYTDLMKRTFAIISEQKMSLWKHSRAKIILSNQIPTMIN